MVTRFVVDDCPHCVVKNEKQCNALMKKWGGIEGVTCANKTERGKLNFDHPHGTEFTFGGSIMHIIL